MSRIAYVNGRYQPFQSASVHVEDRGYQFADGVYEVVELYEHRLIEVDAHLDRLDRSLGALRIVPPMTRAALRTVLAEVVRRNGLSSGLLYVQVTRGVARREHAFPRLGPSSLVVTLRRLVPLPALVRTDGVAVMTLPDQRWGRPDIKSVALLPNILAKQQAKEAGAYEAWLVGGDGLVREGTSSNAWIVTADGALRTHPADCSILNGVTRMALIRLAKSAGIAVVERAFDVAEACQAAEAFLSSSTAHVVPVTRINGHPIGDGHPGPVARRLAEAYQYIVIEGQHS